MANLELSSLISTTPGTASATGAAGAGVGTEAQTLAPSLSFSQLLQGGATQSLSVALAAAGLAGHVEGASEPAMGLQPPSSAGSATTEEVDIVKVGADQQAVISTLTTGAVFVADEFVTGQDGTGDVEGLVAETDGNDVDAPDEKEVAEMVWLGLPLFMESRAALRNNVGSLEGEPSSTSTVATDAEPGMIALRARSMLKSALSLIRSDHSVHSNLGGRPTSLTAELVTSKPTEEVSPARMAGVINPAAPEKTAGLQHTVAIDQALADGMTLAEDASDVLVPVSPLSGADSVALAVAGLKANRSGMDRTVAVTTTPASEISARLAMSAGQASVQEIKLKATAGVEARVVVGQAARHLSISAQAQQQPLSIPSPVVQLDQVLPDSWSKPLVATVAGSALQSNGAADTSSLHLPNEQQQLQARLRLAEPFIQTERIEWDPSTSADEARPVAAVVAGTVVAGSGRPISLPSQDLPSFLAAAHVRPHLPVVADSTEVMQPDVANSSPISRAVEPAVPVGGGMVTQTGAFSTTLSRSGSGSGSGSETSPVFPQATPDTLDLHQKNWGQTLGRQLSWMVSNRMQEAEIRVNPPDLGPIEVRVSLHQNQTSVTFFCHESAVREAIENTLPRLREMMDNQGINLSQTQVSDQSLARQQAGSGEQSAYGQRNGGWSAPVPNREVVVNTAEAQPRSSRLLGVVDHYV